MNLQLLIAAILQGITEFLPVSSSSHLFLFNALQGGAPDPFPYEMVLAAGTLFSTLIYFRRELFWMARDVLRQSLGKKGSAYSHLAWVLVLSTLPACFVGFFAKDFIVEHLRAVWIMGAMQIIFGGLLGLSDLRAQSHQKETAISFKEGLCIGLAQIFSLIPGASRSGTTITAARLLGLNRETAVRFSFLMAIPIVFAATTLETLSVVKQGLTLNWINIGLGFFISAGVGLAAIHLLLRLVITIGLWPFAVYRILLGLAILVSFSPL